jgi:hypothetical protein
MKKPIRKILLIITVLALIFFTMLIMTPNNNNTNLKPVSLPEEISEAKPGDQLQIISVSDSIYIGFNNSKN